MEYNQEQKDAARDQRVVQRISASPFLLQVFTCLAHKKTKQLS